MELEPSIDEQLNSMYNRDYLPSEFATDMNNSTKQILLKVYDQMIGPGGKEEEKDFFTRDTEILRNTAINSLLGKGPITEEKIKKAIENHIEKQKEFYLNWKAQQAINFLNYSYN